MDYRNNINFIEAIKNDIDIKRYFDIYCYGGLKLLIFAIPNDAVTIVGKIHIASTIISLKDSLSSPNCLACSSKSAGMRIVTASRSILATYAIALLYHIA